MWYRRTGVTLASSLVLIASACGPGAVSGGNPDLRGTIVISGSSTVEPVSSLAAEIFAESYPSVAISVDGPGTGDGFELFCNGETNISDASRPIADDEIAACEANGVDFVELEVAFDGITVMTNPVNTVDCLNTGDLYALFGPESAGLDSWASSDALAAEVGGTGGLPEVPLEITAPGEESGTYDAFIELSGIDTTAEDRGVPEDQASSLRSDYQASPNDNIIITAMEGSDSPLGFVGFAFANEAGDRVKEIQIDGGEGCVSPSEAAIADGSYPLSRSLFIYVNTDHAAESPALRAYVDSYLSPDGLDVAVTEVGYVALPDDRAESARSAWAEAMA